MIIRREQIQAFEATLFENFKKRLVNHVNICFPKQYESMSVKSIRSFVELGIRSAQKYGFATERDICGYIDLMIIFGPNFDTDRRIPWAGALLRDDKVSLKSKMPTLLRYASGVLKILAG